MTTDHHLAIRRDARGVVTITFNHGDRNVNVFDEAMLDELREAITEVYAMPRTKLVVFKSGKPTGFFVGADVHAIAALMSPEQAAEVCRQGQSLFRDVANLPCPTIAVIHGPCLGGGLEFAMACTYRVARDDESTRLGLPETQLGLIPGWGGTQRLPALVGQSAAMKLIFEGNRISARMAKAISLVDLVVPPDDFELSVEKFINDRLSTPLIRKSRSSYKDWVLDHTRLGRWLSRMFASRHLAKRASHYPALMAAHRTIEMGQKNGFDTGLEAERKEFSHLLFAPATRNLLDLFFQRERARNLKTWLAADPAFVPSAGHVGVIGGGTMGAGIAELLILKGFQVTIMEISDALAVSAKSRVETLLDQAIKQQTINRAERDLAIGRLYSSSHFDDLKSCDVAIEAIVERLDLKQQLFSDLDRVLPRQALLVSNTSALPICKMAEVTARSGQVAGLHFFNPVHKMPLIEVVRSRETSDDTMAILLKLAKQLGKTPIVVRESPGFLVNRVLFPYLEEAMRLVLEGVVVDRIDRAAKRFGMPIGPLELLDSVGLDVALDVAHSLGENPAASPTLELLEKLVQRKRMGRKSQSGFYEYRDGRKVRAMRFAEDVVLLPMPMVHAVTLGEEVIDGITQRLIFSMINASAEAVREAVVTEPWMADLAMVLGTGFAPFRGGPMKLIETWGRDDVLRVLLNLQRICGERFAPSRWFLQASRQVNSKETVS